MATIISPRDHTARRRRRAVDAAATARRKLERRRPTVRPAAFDRPRSSSIEVLGNRVVVVSRPVE